MKKITSTLAFLSFFCYIAKAQVSTGEQPVSWQFSVDRMATTETVPTVTLPFLDMEAIHREDNINDNSGIPMPVRFGFPHKVNLSMDNSGIPRHKELTASSGADYILIVSAMSFMENGKNADISEIKAGFNLQSRLVMR